MSKNLHSCINELEAICAAKNTIERKKLIEKNENCILHAIKEVIRNTIKGNIKLNSRTLKKLRKQKKLLKKVADKRTKSKTIKKIFIKQVGGNLLKQILPFLLDTLTTLAPIGLALL